LNDSPVPSSRRKDPLLKAVARAGYRAVTGARATVFARRARPGAAPSVFYGGARSGDNGGPLVKVQRLQQAFPQSSGGFNLVYSLSNAPYLSPAALDLLNARGTGIVHNQNGVFYPGWYDGDWERENARMAAAYHRADHVFWQSRFCRECADQFLGQRQGPGEILFNAVDTTHFSAPDPRTATGAQPFRFLLTGKIQAHLSYRLEDTIAGLAAARADGLNASLTIAGHLDAGATAAALAAATRAGVQAHVDLIGPYTQDTAPDIYRAADAYVMTKHADPCPNTVIEAMACGLPVVHVASGGVPELVGPDAGAGIAADNNWDEPFRPSATALAAAMQAVAHHHTTMSDAARQRAVAAFSLDNWIARHRDVFRSVLATKA
jgi:glycosyltransferase involved in cell wall biosynthesis